MIGEAEKQMAPGDVVYLKAESPRLTVVSVGDVSATLTFMRSASDGLETMQLPAAALTRERPEGW